MSAEGHVAELGGIRGTVINASFPRSGHRFLRTILTQYFGAGFVFYEPYEKRIICTDKTRESLNHVNFVKTHDFELEGHLVLSKTFPVERKYLVQLRHPLESITSYYEFSLKHKTLLVDHRLAWKWFLKSKLEYWKGFCREWVIKNTNQSLIIRYEDITENTFDVCAEVITYLTETPSFDGVRLAKLVESQEFLQYVSDRSSGKTEKRQLRLFKYYEPELFCRIEKEMLEDYLKPAGIRAIF